MRMCRPGSVAAAPVTIHCGGPGGAARRLVGVFTQVVVARRFTVSPVRAEGTFTTHEFTAVDVAPAFEVRTGTEVGVATMEKRFSGDVDGRSATVFTAAFDQASGVGTYVAMESFDGSLGGVAGTFNFAHVASTRGTDRLDESFLLVPGSGTGGLAGIAGSGGMTIDADGTHRVWFDYTLGE